MRARFTILKRRLMWWWRLCMGNYDDDRDAYPWWIADKDTYIPELAASHEITEDRAFLLVMDQMRERVFRSCLYAEVVAFLLSIGLAIVFDGGPIWPSLVAVGAAFVFDHIKSKNKRFHGRHNRYARLGSSDPDAIDRPGQPDDRLLL